MKSRTRDAVFKVIRKAARTSTGTQDWEIEGLGHPKAGMFFGSFADSNDSAKDNYAIGMGIVDGVNQFSNTASSRHNLGAWSIQAYRRGSNDSTFYLMKPTIANVNTKMALTGGGSGILENGYQFDYSVANDATLITGILIAGDEIEAKVGYYRANIPLDAYIDCSCGFDPDIVLMIGDKDTATSWNSNKTHGQYVFGCAIRTGASGVKQVSTNYTDYAWRAKAEFYAYLSDEYVSAHLDDSGLVQGHDLEWISGGFRIYTRETGSARHRGTYLALKLPNDMRCSLEWVKEPTTTQVVQKVLGWRPQILIGSTTYCSGLNTWIEDTSAGAIGCGVIAEGSMMSSIGIASLDDVAPTNTQSICDRKFINTPSGDGTSAKKATAQLKNYGYDLDYSAVSSPGKYHWVLAIEESKRGRQRSSTF